MISSISPGTRRLFLVTHLTLAVGLVGVALALVALGIAGLGGADPATVYPAMHTVAIAALTPLAIAALTTGLLQAALTRRHVLRQGWLATKLGITVLLLAATVLVAVPGLGRSADAAVTPGQELAPAQQLVPTLTPALALVLLAVAAWLGVVKPSRRRAG